MNSDFLILALWVIMMVFFTIVSLHAPGLAKLMSTFMQSVFTLVATNVAYDITRMEGLSRWWSILPFVFFIISTIVVFYSKARPPSSGLAMNEYY